MLFHNFSGYDCHLIIEDLLRKAHALGLNIQILPKSMENYISVQMGCSRFLNGYRFLSTSLDKLVKNQIEFTILETFNCNDKLKQKLAYPYGEF